MAEASIEAGKGKVPDGPMMADVGDGTTAITLPERVDNSNVQAVLQSLEYAGKPLAVHNPPRKLVSLAELYGVADFLLDDHPELRRMRQEREEKGQ